METDSTEDTGKSADPKFDNWILVESFHVIRKSKFVFLALLPVLFLVILADQYLSRVFLIDGGAVTQGAIVRMALREVALSLVFAIPMLVLAFVVHASVLRHQFSWQVFQNIERSKLRAFFERSILVLAMCAFVSLVPTILFIFDVVYIDGKLTVKPELVSTVAVITFLTAGCGFLMLIWTITWPVSVILDSDNSIQRCFRRGKKTFWYIIGRVLLISPALLVIAMVASAVIVPVAKALVEAGTTFSASPLGLPIWLAVPIGVINSVLYAISTVVVAVIISRAFLVGEARLNNDQSGERSSS